MLQNGLERKRKLIMFFSMGFLTVLESFFIHLLGGLTSERKKVLHIKRKERRELRILLRDRAIWDVVETNITRITYIIIICIELW